MSKATRLMPTVFSMNQNLWDTSNDVFLANLYTGASAITGTSDACIIAFPISPNTTYTVSKENSDRFILATTQTMPANNVRIYNRTDYGVTNASRYSITLTTGASDQYIIVYIARYGSADGFLDAWKVKLEHGSIATRYSPF